MAPARRAPPGPSQCEAEEGPREPPGRTSFFFLRGLPMRLEEPRKRLRSASEAPQQPLAQTRGPSQRESAEAPRVEKRELCGASSASSPLDRLVFGGSSEGWIGGCTLLEGVGCASEAPRSTSKGSVALADKRWVAPPREILGGSVVPRNSLDMHANVRIASASRTFEASPGGRRSTSNQTGKQGWGPP